MTDSPTKCTSKNVETTSTSVNDAKVFTPIAFPPEAEKVIEILQKFDPRSLPALLGTFLQIVSFGPYQSDQQALKMRANVEMHAENCYLKGYQDTLKHRDAQNERDHRFRIKKLNHETIVKIMTLTAAIMGAAIGFYLYVHDNKQLGGYVLLGSFFLLYNLVMNSKTPSLPTP
jgi:hypothetical protein